MLVFRSETTSRVENAGTETLESRLLILDLEDADAKETKKKEKKENHLGFTDDDSKERILLLIRGAILPGLCRSPLRIDAARSAIEIDIGSRTQHAVARWAGDGPQERIPETHFSLASN